MAIYAAGAQDVVGSQLLQQLLQGEKQTCSSLVPADEACGLV